MDSMVMMPVHTKSDELLDPEGYGNKVLYGVVKDSLC